MQAADLANSVRGERGLCNGFIASTTQCRDMLARGVGCPVRVVCDAKLANGAESISFTCWGC